MSRMVREIEVNGRKLTALFDTGSTNTYIRGEFVPSNRLTLKRPFRVGLGGERRQIEEICVFEGEIEGLEFSTEGYLIQDLGTVNNSRLDAIIGARTMEAWEIRLDPKSGELDLSGLKRRDFTEYITEVISR